MTTRLLLAALLMCACETRTKPDATLPDTMPAAPIADTYVGPKACGIVTSDDAQHITGITYDSGVVTNDYMGDTQCKLVPKDTSKTAIMVSLHAHGRLEPYQKVPNSVRVPGLGDSAVWHDGNAQLAVAVDSAVFSISFLKPPARMQWATQLAQIALKKF